MKRAEFTKKTKRLALDRSGGHCEAVGQLYGLDKGKRCNLSLEFGVEFDHAVRAADGGENTLENCVASCKKCHAFKTRKFDVPQAAKTKRMNDKQNGIDRPKGSIQSAGFPKKQKVATSAPPPRRPMFAAIEE